MKLSENTFIENKGWSSSASQYLADTGSRHKCRCSNSS